MARDLLAFSLRFRDRSEPSRQFPQPITNNQQTTMILFSKINMTRRKDALGKTRFGRLCVRVLGNDRGAVMMEYVILAVLIAAAAVVAVAMFGKTLVGMFDTAAKGATGDNAGAQTTQEATRTTQGTDADTARTEADEYVNR